jgi:hypothetical protein
MNVRVEPELLDGLQTVFERDGVTPAEQVRRAIRLWLQDRGVLEPPPPKTKTARKRAATRQRA